VLPAISTGTCKKRINSGAVITPAPTPVSADNDGDAKSDDKIHFDTLSECVLRGLQMDAALLLFATQRPERGALGSSGRLVQGSQPMLE